MGGAPGTFTTHVPGVIPIIKPPTPPGDLSMVLLARLGGERVTFSPPDCFLGLASGLFLGVDVASTSELFSVEAEPERTASPTRDSLLGGPPGVATELLTLMLLLLYHGDGNPMLEGVGGENGNLKSWGYICGYKERGGVPTLLPPGVGKPDIPAVLPTKELLLPGEFARKALQELVRLGASLAWDRSTDAEGESVMLEGNA